MALGIAPAVPTSLHPDHDLLALSRRHAAWTRRIDQMIQLQCEAQEVGNSQLDDRVHNILVRIAPRLHALEWQVSQLRCLTCEGLEAKARVAVTTVQRLLGGEPYSDYALLWSLCRDVLGGEP
jgi:hypothetical protein